MPSKEELRSLLIAMGEAAQGKDASEARLVLNYKELEALHEGNIARFGLRPGEFEMWRMKK